MAEQVRRGIGLPRSQAAGGAVRMCSGAPVRISSAAANAAAALPGDSTQGAGGRGRLAGVTAPVLTPLPPTPASSELHHVLPYLFQLALADKGLLLRLSLAFSAMAVSKLSGLAVPLLFKQAIDHLTSNSIPEIAMKGAMVALLLSGLCRVAAAVCKELQHVIFSPVSQAAGRRVAFHTFNHVLNMDMQFHLNRRTGELSRKLERGTRSVGMVFRAVVFTFMPTVVELLLVCGILWSSFSAPVAGLVVATFVAYIAWTASLTGRATESRKQLNVMDDLTSGKAIDALLNFETVNLFNNATIEVAQYDHYLRGYQKAALDTERLSAVLNAGQGAILAIGLTAVCCAANASSGTTAGDLVMISGLLLQLWAPLQFLGFFYRELRRSLVDMEAFFDIMKTSSQLKDGRLDLCATHMGEPTSSNGANGAAPACAGFVNAGLSVQLDDVHFGYRDRKVLNGVSFTVDAGQSVAIVGPSGSGKSTILKLILRLYDTDSGSIFVDGVDVCNLRLASMREAMAVVPQDTVLFNDTIYHNIEYGRPGATEAEVLEAASMAKLDSTIANMPDGYETLVGERGLKLSGGEKQRVAIARAFLRAPRLLICDESTSALDTNTESGILASLSELAVGRTSVFVAHRLSTIRHCDKIVVMRDGRVIEEGSHDELLRRGAVYHGMWQAQQKAEVEEVTTMANA
eukprot:jgi/Tetstr1/442031/TSEL_030212.t1